MLIPTAIEQVVGGVFSGARVRRTTDQIITHNTSTSLSFDQERYDAGGYWTDGSPTRFTIPATGYYRITLNLRWDGAGGGAAREAWFLVNGTTTIADVTDPPSSALIGQLLSCDVNLAAGDYVEAFVYQDRGSDLNVKSHVSYTPEFSIHLIGT